MSDKAENIIEYPSFHETIATGLASMDNLREHMVVHCHPDDWRDWVRYGGEIYGPSWTAPDTGAGVKLIHDMTVPRGTVELRVRMKHIPRGHES